MKKTLLFSVLAVINVSDTMAVKNMLI